MTAIVVSLDGSRSVQDTVDAKLRTADEANALGEELAARIVVGGAEEGLNDINANRPAKD
ncbi:porphobilinogen deaminase Hem3 [Penicillium cataractarum]|uniref:Pre-uroporphyrinogen synthase n=1 Tax=Penicillium cataractarum TaxID=2100454 RepID=A0A9W9VXD1_9EURO|nr:porphobilinogen deaminase Hem3 [Penicillium cataractarum]KAJ5390909.1 porphobilinogen deaminase Hem3 [Penicillium cataractarum]